MAIASFLLLANGLDSSSYASLPHSFSDLTGDVIGHHQGIYDARRRVPTPLNMVDLRVAQQHAFDEVDPLILSKLDLEAMVGRSLPFASETALEDINYGRPEEISDTRRRDRVINFITPTYKRMTQMVDLVRMSQTLQAAAYTQIGIIHWIVIEDAAHPTHRIRSLLQRSGLPFSHLARESQAKASGHGMVQRNLAIDVVREMNVDGVVYFADDDNAYDTELVTELTRTKSVAIFAVGLSGNGSYERCHVDEATGRVDRLISGARVHRKLAIDMAGFAFSTAWDAHKNFTAGFNPGARVGSLEPSFLKLVVEEPSDFQPLAANCTRVLVWHTRTHIKHANTREMLDDPHWKYISAWV